MHDRPVIQVHDLSVDYQSENGPIHAVSHMSFDAHEKQVVALVGESGCGKTTLALSMIRLLPSPPGKIVSGQVILEERDILSLPSQEVQKFRGTGIGMIFQEPLSSLNPVLKIREQMGEAILIRKLRSSDGHLETRVYSYRAGESRIESPFKKLLGTRVLRHVYPSDIEEEMVRALKLVRIADPERILNRYPFELSGGMRQRVMIAMVLSQNPRILIADEPTSFLDVTTQAQVLRLMRELADKTMTSLLIITHDLGVAAQIADRVLVMYAGELMEDATADELFTNPLHPYTKALLGCLPKGSKANGPLGSIRGSVPDLRQDINWCPFVDRCPYAMNRCREEHPLLEGDERHRVSCFLYSK